MTYDSGGKVLIWPKMEKRMYSQNGRIDFEANGAS